MDKISFGCLCCPWSVKPLWHRTPEAGTLWQLSVGCRAGGGGGVRVLGPAELAPPAQSRKTPSPPGLASSVTLWTIQNLKTTHDLISSLAFIRSK